MKELNKLCEVFSKNFDMIQEIAKKYPYSTEHVKTVLEQNNYNKEKEKLYVMVTVFDFEYEEEKS